MWKLLILVAAVAGVAYWLKRRHSVTGTVTALYSDAKVSSPGGPTPGDSSQTALTGPAQYTY